MPTISRLHRVVVWIALTAFGSNVLASPIDLASSPLVTGIGKNVAPNIFFILDDSGSMNDEFMPDSVETDFDADKPCALNFGYNTIYFNPSTTYVMPKNSDGTNRAYVPTVASALPNGFAAASGSNVAVDLTSTTPVYGPIILGLPNPAFATTNVGTTAVKKRVTVTQTGHPFGVAGSTASVTFSGTPTSGTIGGINWTNITNQTFTITVINANSYYFSQATTATAVATGGGANAKVTYTGVTSTTPDHFYYNYTATPTSPPSTCAADGSYTKVTVISLGATARSNYAIWYSYYRTRLAMMKSAAGRAFVGLNDKYRVGFTTISEKGIGATKFLDIKKFDTTQKSDWFTKLYGSSGSSSTPLRGALSKAGRYYAGKFADTSTGAHDPIQFSCQKNFTILTTDGFWNTGDESPTSDTGTIGLATANYGPFKMDNVTRVADQDGVTGVTAPFRDSSAAQNTLADVAYYYYTTDLRPTSGSLGGPTEDAVPTRLDVSTNNVPTSNSDPATHQHMATFTLGLGLDGTLANPTDYAAILAGSKNWPNPIATSTTQDLKRVDDLWHAAVNGRGVTGDGGNLSAKSPDAVVSELSQALQAVNAVVGSSSAAATSNLQPVDGDNTAFIAQYKTVSWTGDLVARTIDVITGAIPTTNAWSAQTLLDSLNPTTGRNIYTYSTAGADAATKLRPFTAARLTAEIAANYFKSDGTNPGGALPQYSGFNLLQQTASTQSAMIDFLRGVRTNEGSGILATQLFREREHVLGDIVSAAPVFVRKPPFAYTDGGYASFTAGTAIVNRGATVYVGANDGMLHAFDGTVGQTNSGRERWAYVPTMLIKNLYKTASSDYSLNHRFYVDGPITVGDAHNSSGWSTILVGGLGGGGKGYYALDVTDPASPKALWEFGAAADFVGDLSFDADVGYSYGNPVITKRDSDGRWVVIFTSGYNNTPYNATTNPTGTGDAKGHLYVVDAFTGEKLSDILTSTSANEELSGISRIANYVANGLRNNLTQYVYAGDLSGALWRFDINDDSVLHMADTSSTPGAQPITTQPELARITAGADAFTVVYFGTGRFLGPNDLSTGAPSTAVAQAIYAVKDTGANLGVLTDSGAALVAQTLNSTVSPRTSTNNAVDWSTSNGWYLTTPVGERFNVDPGLQLGTLVMAANIPASDYCKPTGSSILYQLSYKSGFVLKTNTFAAQTVGTTQLQLGGSGAGSGSVHGGKIVIESVLADGTTVNTDQENGGGAAGNAVRISWREIE